MTLSSPAATMPLTAMATPSAPTPRKRVPSSERRDALIEAAVHEFARGGLHGTPVERIAKRVGVAQPYVFSLFAGKRELFLAAADRNFAMLRQLFSDAAAAFDPATAEPDASVRQAMGNAYVEMLINRREYLMFQIQAYAACDDEVIREHVRRNYALLVEHVREVSGLEGEELDDFFRYGMWLNVTAALGVADLSAGCEWMQAEAADSADPGETGAASAEAGAANAEAPEPGANA
jgi:AcrR family transcriptional regulator